MTTVAKKKSEPDLSGIIRADEVIPVALFKKMVGMKRYAFGQAVAEGLLVRHRGRRAYVIGRDWLEFLAKQPAESPQKSHRE